MERDGVDFTTALRTLCGMGGVDVRVRTTRVDAQRKRTREALDGAIASTVASAVPTRFGRSW